ncbi:invasion associated locus B family protein [Brucella pseudintermedia]|uniref:invasion associated locus B family protein n=1 Tax=Brucella pseudintermedia TaxID=370111 RepID=UPI00124CA0D0|nr:invasion associated locus B family protein [Brucella pseudintermedia]KAB2680907.1 invasion associated locus B family protein [Brucella pseudintermedia]
MTIPLSPCSIDLLIASALLPATPVLALDAPSLPGGASSLQETYQDWRVACRIAAATKRCALSQQQIRKNGQRVLTIELQTGPNNTITGNLILPFGLLLDAGVTPQIDEQSPMAALFFRTCLPVGCIVPAAFDQPVIDRLRAGSALKLTAKSSNAEQDVTFSISLNGLSAALDRFAELHQTASQ